MERAEVQSGSREMRLSLEPRIQHGTLDFSPTSATTFPSLFKPVQIRFLPLAVKFILIYFVLTHCEMGVSCQDN